MMMIKINNNTNNNNSNNKLIKKDKQTKEEIDATVEQMKESVCVCVLGLNSDIISSYQKDLKKCDDNKKMKINLLFNE